MKQKIISQLKTELNYLEYAENLEALNKHIYAMQSLLDVLKDERDLSGSSQQTGALNNEDAKTLELMRGKKSYTKDEDAQPLQRERKETEDGIGNGEDIFDF